MFLSAAIILRLALLLSQKKAGNYPMDDFCRQLRHSFGMTLPVSRAGWFQLGR